MIAIISILAGLLLPALEDALLAARAVSCLSNQKQLMFSVTAYPEDNNGSFPTHVFQSGHRSWMWHMINNGNMPDVVSGTYPEDERTCPMLVNDYPPGANGYSISHHAFSLYLSSYYNGSTWVYGAPLRVPDLKRPSKTYTLADAWYWVPEGSGSYTGKVSGGTWGFSATKIGPDVIEEPGYTAWSARWIRERHYTGVNISFADGHGAFQVWPYADTTPGSTTDDKATM